MRRTHAVEVAAAAAAGAAVYFGGVGVTSTTRWSDKLTSTTRCRLVLLQLQISFMTEELGLPEARVQKILVKSPKILSYGVERMRDKQCYLEEGLQLGANDVSDNDE